MKPCLNKDSSSTDHVIISTALHLACSRKITTITFFNSAHVCAYTHIDIIVLNSTNQMHSIKRHTHKVNDQEIWVAKNSSGRLLVLGLTGKMHTNHSLKKMSARSLQKTYREQNWLLEISGHSQRCRVQYEWSSEMSMKKGRKGDIYRKLKTVQSLS